MRLSLPGDALTALRQSAGVQSTLSADEQEITLRRGEHAQRYRPIIRPTFYPSHLPGLAEQLREDADALLISTHISAPLAERLLARRIPFIDGAGNAYLDTGRWFVLVTGRSAPAPPRRPARLSAGCWQVAYVLLRDPSAAGLSVRALGERAGVSHGTASSALHALAERGWLRHLGRSGHPVTDPDGLRRAFELGFLDRLSVKLYITRARPVGPRSLHQWGEQLLSRDDAADGLLGGGLAAEQLGADLSASTAAVHVPRWDAAVMRQLRLLPDDSGPVTVMQAFGSDNAHPDHPRLADPLLIRASLLGIVDERLLPARTTLLEHIQARWD